MPFEQERYEAYLSATKKKPEALAAERRAALPAPADAPRWSIIAAGSELSGVSETYRSLADQTYARWELCVAGGTLPKGFSSWEGVRTAGVRKGETPLSAALRQASGNWLLFVAPGDFLAPEALFALSAPVLENQAVDLVYGDEDTLGPDGQRTNPLFKPAFAPHTLMSYDYLGHLTGVSRALFTRAGGLLDFDADSRYDYHLRLMDTVQLPVHVPGVLLTRTLPLCPPSLHGGKGALAQCLRRRKSGGYAAGGLWSGSFAIYYGLKGNPKISIIVADIENFTDVRRLLESIEDMSDYGRYELLLVDEGRHDADTARYFSMLQRNKAARVIEYQHEPNKAAARNLGAREAQGELLLFLDSGLRVETPDFLEVLAALAQQTGVGAVGGKLITPEGAIVSAGIAVGLYGWAGGVYEGAMEQTAASMQKTFVETIRNVTALPGGCLMVQKELFRRMGGFDRTFAEVGWDTEFCIRLLQKDLYNVYTPYVRFVKFLDHRDRPQPTRENLRRCMDVYRPMLIVGDPYFGPQYDYSSPIPRLAVPPAAPITLNPGTRI